MQQEISNDKRQWTSLTWQFCSTNRFNAVLKAKSLEHVHKSHNNTSYIYYYQCIVR